MDSYVSTNTREGGDVHSRRHMMESSRRSSPQTPNESPSTVLHFLQWNVTSRRGSASVVTCEWSVRSDITVSLNSMPVVLFFGAPEPAGGFECRSGNGSDVMSRVVCRRSLHLCGARGDARCLLKTVLRHVTIHPVIRLIIVTIVLRYTVFNSIELSHQIWFEVETTLTLVSYFKVE